MLYVILNQTLEKTTLKTYYRKILYYKSIKINLILFCSLFFTNNLFSQNCVLPSGKYKIEFDKQFEMYPKFEFRILNDSITFYEKDSIVTRKIEKNNSCSLVIEKEIIDETDLTELQKMLNRQHPFYTFKKITDSKFKFIYRVDLHVMINSGKFIRIKTE